MTSALSSYSLVKGFGRPSTGSATSGSAPTAVTATSASSTSVSVAFTAPSGTILYYIVTSSPGSIKAIGTSSPIVVTGLSSGTAYTFTVTATNSGGTSPSSTASSSVIPPISFSASSISGLQVWYDGADPLNTGTAPANGTGVSSWKDKSGRGYDATAFGTAGNYSTSNRSIVFTGTTYYTTNYPANPTAESVFVVFRQSTSATSAAIVSSGVGGRAIAIYNPSTSLGILNVGVTWGAIVSNALPSQGTTYLGEGFFSGTSTYISVNGNLTITGPSTVTAFTSGTLTQLGFQNTTASPNGQFFGNIMEILIYNSNMQASATNRQTIEGYLAWKWGIQASLPVAHPYYSYAPIFGAPSAPTAVTATVASSTSLSVAFTPPNGLITSYTVTSSPSSITATGSSSPIVVTGLTTGTAYTFTVTATGSYGTSPASTASASATPVAGFTRTTISGLQLWLDAADSTTVTQSSNLISAWTDKSTNSYSMIQANSAARPTYVANSLNSKSGIQLSTTSYLYQLSTNMPNYTTSTSMTLYVMMKTPTAAAGGSWYLISTNWFNNNFASVANGTSRYHFSLYNSTTAGCTLYANGASAVTGTALAINGTNAIVGFSVSSTNSTMSVNGTVTTGTGYTLPSSTGATDTVYIGDTRGSSTVSNQVIYEMLGFNTQLSLANRQFVEGYLAWKWGIQASLPVAHPYYSAAPTY